MAANSIASWSGQEWPGGTGRTRKIEGWRFSNSAPDSWDAVSGRIEIPCRPGNGGVASGAGYSGARNSESVTGNAVLAPGRSEEHTSELQSPTNIVCRLLLE